jgi:hypothetical protein
MKDHMQALIGDAAHSLVREMPETKQLNFDLKEVAAALIKEEGIREGRWMLGFEFGFGAGNFATGPTATDTKPGAFAQIKAVVLVRQEEGAPDLPFVIDAAEVHERSAGGKASCIGGPLHVCWTVRARGETDVVGKPAKTRVLENTLADLKDWAHFERTAAALAPKRISRSRSHDATASLTISLRPSSG